MLFVLYVIAWLSMFFALVGFEPDLIVSYFAMGWTFSGLEMPSFVWLFSWPAFAFMLSAWFIGKRVIWECRNAA
ncbi:MAG: hypothetical protein IPO95_00880 [Rhodanobacteraceae bacterium]|nr:hypothetical protein [Rhodanobacteraceae bacterium]